MADESCSVPTFVCRVLDVAGGWGGGMLNAILSKLSTLVRIEFKCFRIQSSAGMIWFTPVNLHMQLCSLLLVTHYVAKLPICNYNICLQKCVCLFLKKVKK